MVEAEVEAGEASAAAEVAVASVVDLGVVSVVDHGAGLVAALGHRSEVRPPSVDRQLGLRLRRDLRCRVLGQVSAVRGRALAVEISVAPIGHHCNQELARAWARAPGRSAIGLRHCRARGRVRESVPAQAPVRLAIVLRNCRALDRDRELAPAQVSQIARAPEDLESATVRVFHSFRRIDCQDLALPPALERLAAQSRTGCRIKEHASRIAWPIGHRWKIAERT